MPSCTIAICCYSTSRGLLRTLNSIIGQRVAAHIKLAIFHSGDKKTLLHVERVLRLNPWLPQIDLVFDDIENTREYLCAQIEMDYILFLSGRDELTLHSLQRLLSFAQENDAGAVFGAVRLTNLSNSWSHPLVDSFFKLPSYLAAAAATATAQHLTTESNTSIALYHRDFLYPSLEKNADRETYVLHDYVCRKAHDRKYMRTDKYPVRNARFHRFAKIDREPFPEFYGRKKPASNNAWLFGERGGHAAEDNGWALFTYCVDHCRELDCYYILSSNSNIELPEAYISRTLVMGTVKWQEKLFEASHILFTDTAADVLESATDTLIYTDIHYVYLTHGYLGYFSGVYQRQHQYIDYVICTSHKDVETAAKEWCFPSSKFLRSGLPRWDRLTRNTEPSREVLFCPTWRKEFDSSSWKLDSSPTDDAFIDFVDSDFYKSIVSLLTSQKLLEWLASGDLYITVNLHFRLQKFLPAFGVIEHPRITIVSGDIDGRSLSEMLQNACLLITDYSSIMWDMAYMEKPVICFQHDKAAILGERKKEYYDISDLELPFCITYTEAELISALQSVSMQLFKGASCSIDALDTFIPHRSGGNSRRAVEAIVQQTTHQLRAERPVFIGGRVEPADVYPSRNYKQQASNVGKIALITSDQYPCQSQTVRLTSSNWKEAFSGNNFDRLIVEPSLVASDSWADIFFSIDDTRIFLNDALEKGRSTGIPITLSVPPFITYQKYLADLYPQFEEVTFTDQAYIAEGDYEISVIIPTYNGEQYLARSIDSVLNQRFNGKIQIVVIDDGSTDATPEIIDRYANSNSNVLAIRQENSRQGMARNQGILAAGGTYITFLDSDDVLPENALSELWTIALRHNTRIAAGIVTSCQEGGKNQKINQSYYHYSKAPEVIDAEHWPHVFYDPSCVGKLYKRSFLWENKLFFPQSFHEDQVFCFNLFSTNEKIAITSKVVYFYVARQSTQAVSGTQVFSAEKFRQILLAGTLASETVQHATLTSAVKDHAKGFLLLRYDRFIWKRSSGQLELVDDSQFVDEFRALQRLVRSISDQVVVDNTRYFPLLFLLVKRGNYELAAQVYRGNPEEAVEYFRSEEDFPLELLGVLLDSKRFKHAYNYYTAVPLNDPDGDSDLVTEMSYGYRLGAIFVDALKSPIKTLHAPFKLAALGFDMATLRGRQKQEDAKIRLQKNSHQALQNHSAFIKSTAGYQVGVAILEAITRGPGEIFALPARIRRIYYRTKPS